MIGQPYASGRWVVKAGEEDEFVTRWTNFTQWTLETFDGAQEFHLIRDDKEPTHFISFGAWADEDERSKWRASEGFAAMLGACRQLCDEFEGRDYKLVSNPTR